jgi:cyclopropane-fatty-acyl-phospholipid synthase
MNTKALAGALPADASASAGMLGLAERGLLPDVLVRYGIRRLLAQRLRTQRAGGPDAQEQRQQQLLQQLRVAPIALHTEAANRQHYELPPDFFRACLGPRLKYSCAYFARGDETLGEAEDAMLDLYAERAQLADGQSILELGCGWGSLSLWMAERYPRATILALSNSRAQCAFIEARCRERGLRNLRLLRADVNQLELAPAQFDRCVSIEMFEHLRNYEALLGRIAGWLKPEGRLFVHIFAHRTLLYPFETDGADNWLGRHFFTGGLMPAADTLLAFQRALQIEERWLLPGTHYQRTAEAWLRNQDARGEAVQAILGETYGSAATLWQQRWRMFWMACAELFGYAHGTEWLVAHYRFARAAR